MSEKTILNKLQLLATSLGHRLFRNNVGTAWRGEVHKLKNGDILIKNPVLIRYGLADGSGDLIGGTQVEITPEMVGRKVLIFTNYEVKANKTRTTENQINFSKMITQLGGVSIIDRFSSGNIEGNSYVESINKFRAPC